MTDRRQIKKQRRAERIESERRAASRRELFRRVVLGVGLGLVLVLTLVVVSLDFGSDDPLLEGLSGTYKDYYQDRTTACDGQDPTVPWVRRSFEQPVANQVEAGETVSATFNTSCGSITVALDSANYPETVNSFVFLARQGFYDWTVFHRVAPEFIIVGGDPDADGSGGPGYTIDNEFPPDEFRFSRGMVGMWNDGSGSTGSQFFFAIGEDAEVLRRYNVLGTVTEGMDVLDTMTDTPLARRSGNVETSFPLESIYLEQVQIVTSPISNP